MPHTLLKRPFPQRAFTWTEMIFLLFVLSVLLVVAITFMGKTKHDHRGVIDASNIRQIGQASLIYANDNRELLPGMTLTSDGELDEKAATPHIHAIAAALARGGGLNDMTLWFVARDSHPDVLPGLNGPILTAGLPRRLNPSFAASGLGYQYVAGLETAHPSTTPIAFTRGLQLDGTWPSSTVSPFGADGGHIVFLGGNVQFNRNLGTGSSDGRLIDRSGTRTQNIHEAIPETARIFSQPESNTGSPAGMAPAAP
jgi:competence protein ComGC